MTPADIILYAQPLLEKQAGVVGVGYGLKERGGVVTSSEALRVYVRTKDVPHRRRRDEEIPPAICGMATDVIEHSPGLAAAARRTTELGAGARIANAKGIPGTLGCHCRRTDDHSQVLLTSWHVLFGGGAREHSKIWAVEQCDGVRTVREIGTSLYGTIGTVSMDGEQFHIDCAVGSRTKDLRTRAQTIRGCAEAKPGDHVTKTGGTTGETEGVVVDVSYPDLAVIENRTFAATRQVLVRSLDPERAFSAEGDSGAAILNGRREVVALLWGTNCRGEGVACHIRPILQTLRIEVEPGPPEGLRERIAKLLRRPGDRRCN